MLGFEVEGEVDYKEATWVNLEDYGDEYTFTKTHRLTLKTNKNFNVWLKSGQEWNLKKSAIVFKILRYFQHQTCHTMMPKVQCTIFRHNLFYPAH